MSMMERMDDRTVAEYCFTDGEPINVFINRATEIDELFANWCFEIRVFSPWGDDLLVQGASDFASLCGCDECVAVGVELLEYYSLSLALIWIKENRRIAGQVKVWANSERLKHDADNGFSGSKGRYQCPFLRTIYEDLSNLTDELGCTYVDYRRIEPVDSRLS